MSSIQIDEVKPILNKLDQCEAKKKLSSSIAWNLTYSELWILINN